MNRKTKIDAEYSAADERALLLRARNGDDEAFGEIVRRHQARLRAFAARYLDDPHDIYDTVQDAFIDAYTHLDRFDLDREFGPWLRTICRNRVLNFIRARKAQRTVSLQIVDESLLAHIGNDNHDDFELSARIAALKTCLTKLKDSQRQLLERRYGDREALKSIAASMNQSAASLGMQLFRIRTVLRRCMQQHLSSDLSG